LVAAFFIPDQKIPMSAADLSASIPTRQFSGPGIGRKTVRAGAWPHLGSRKLHPRSDSLLFRRIFGLVRISKPLKRARRFSVSALREKTLGALARPNDF